MDILDDDYLLRRIPRNNPDYIKEDGTICSYAFKPPGKNINEISVNIKRLTTYNDTVINKDDFCLAQIQASVVRNNNLTCVHKPEEDNYSHASITGEFKNSVCKNLARSSEIIKEDNY